MKIALTGVTGNMGKQVLKSLFAIDGLEFRLLILPGDRRIKYIKKAYKKQIDRIEIVRGNIADRSACETLVDGVDYVINMAAVIPPTSGARPDLAVECNQIGVDTLLSVMEKQCPNTKLIHISTVALYGNRDYRHMWGRVGDPLLVSPFDIYSITKLRGEYRVLESTLSSFVVLRQTGMLHENLMRDNLSSGLIFHNCFNTPLEWVTAEDSGLLLANIIRRDMAGELHGEFWGKVFNIGGGQANRLIGYDVLNEGFAVAGGSAKTFFKPSDNVTRNFHGVWYSDSDKLDEMFHFRRQDLFGFWRDFAKKNPIMSLGKLVPRTLIKYIAVTRLFKKEDSPAYWKKHNDEANIYAYFGTKEMREKLADRWEDFGLLKEGKTPDGQPIDYDALRDKGQAKLPLIGFDPDGEVTLDDLRNIAHLHGGKLLSNTGGVNDRLQWQNSDGEVFTARGYTVMAGHWLNPCYTEFVWDFDRLAKRDSIYADIWYDSHDRDEDKCYYCDEQYNEFIREIK